MEMPDRQMEINTRIKRHVLGQRHKFLSQKQMDDI